MAIGLGLIVGCGILLILSIFATNFKWIPIFLFGLLVGMFIYMDLPHILGHCEHYNPKVEKLK